MRARGWEGLGGTGLEMCVCHGGGAAWHGTACEAGGQGGPRTGVPGDRKWPPGPGMDGRPPRLAAEPLPLRTASRLPGARMAPAPGTPARA